MADQKEVLTQKRAAVVARIEMLKKDQGRVADKLSASEATLKKIDDELAKLAPKS